MPRDMTSLLSVLVVLFICRMYGRRRHVGRSEPPCPRRPSLRLPRALTVREVAFDYARAVFELVDIAEPTKQRALTALESMIVPLAGGFGLDEVTPELQAGVRLALLDEVAGDGRAAAIVWDDLLRWGRRGLVPQQHLR